MLQSATFYFSESSNPFTSAGVTSPQTLTLRNASGTWSQQVTPSRTSFSGMAVSFTFTLSDITTDNLILDVTNFGEWTMMTEADFTGSAIPEPSTYAAIAGISMLGFAMWRRRRQVVR
jgi:hypothetical protein